MGHGVLDPHKGLPDSSGNWVLGAGLGEDLGVEQGVCVFMYTHP